MAEYKTENTSHIDETSSSTSELKFVVDTHHGVPDLPVQEALAAELDQDKQRLRKIQRRVDLRLVVTLAILYIWSYIDRGNLGNAYIAGMAKDLALTVGNRYSIVTMTFFIGYVLVDIPTMVLVRKIGASVFISTIVVVWGAVTVTQGFIQSWGPLLACRLILGILEGGMLPAAMFLINVWFAVFYCAGIAATGFSGLLAYGIEDMNGDAGISGWRWIYIIEGVVTCGCGIAAFFILIDLPERSMKRSILGLPAFLSEKDASIILAHIERDRGDSAAEPITFKSMLRNLSDWKVWEFSYLVMSNTAGYYAFSYFLPVILQQSLHFSTGKAQLYTFPPFAVAAVWTLICAWFCDRFQIRGPVIIFNSCVYVIGVVVMGFCTTVGVRYAGVFLGCLGLSGNLPTNWAYQQNNTVGQAKRALCAAMMTAFGACGGIIAGNVFRAQDAPTYRPGLTVCMIFQGITIVLIAKNFFVFSRANKKADRGEVVIENQPGFRYTY